LVHRVDAEGSASMADHRDMRGVVVVHDAVLGVGD